MKKRKLVLLLVVALIVAAAAAGRLYARYSALRFGKELADAFSMVSRPGFADTDGLRAFFAQPEMESRLRLTRRLAFLGGAYDQRLDELQSVMIYYSTQVALPEGERFATPPKFKYFAIETRNHSEEAIAAAAARAIIGFADQL